MNTNRIERLLRSTQACIAYLTAGDGGIAKTVEAALALIKGGVNLLEIGVPFSDPVADGPVIQRASERALRAGTTLDDILEAIAQIRQQTDIPIVLFSYLNPLFSKMQEPSFFKTMKDVGIDGVLLVDCSLEESRPFHQGLIDNDLAPIYVIASSSSPARIKKINDFGRGFLYYACRQGTTGIQTVLPDNFVEKITAIKQHITLPVVVGFGISTQAQVSAILEQADGAVVGSLFVKALEEGASLEALTALAETIFGEEKEK